ncbi:dynein assembly factor with WDR repeat domains 1 isoform X1 [Condylostylus longicornis]|uniref:dynein assembly factor with WDR repeat domains 1 isoform X1 n=1 Tax=Condylostylus longicornis TaxID=2530218 RepID=UPI00244D9C74|nr:dynein assembly factor with WDR repeat domains 1 isoform X1 [Condylostylus longicornis]
MFWKKICIRYYPPGIAVCYKPLAAEEKIKHIDLLDLNVKTNIEELTQYIIANDDIITSDLYIPLRNALDKIQKKLREPTKIKFYLHKTIQSHILPLTNINFDRSDKCLTGSYDRTCRLINTTSGTEERCFRGHENVVFSVGFNYPICDKIITGSFDKTAKIWSCSNASCLNTYYGHSAEIVSAEFNPNNFDVLVTGSMDKTGRIWHVETAQEIGVLDQHTGEVIAAKYSREGQLILTGSFDNTAFIWDTRMKEYILFIPNYIHIHIILIFYIDLKNDEYFRAIAHLNGHTAALSNCVWNFPGNLVATSSLDGTARIWDIRSLIGDQSLFLIRGHEDEVLDITFDYCGKRVATSSSDTTAKVWSIEGDLNLSAIMTGHSDEVSKVCFSPSGCLLLTASADKTSRLWFSDTGVCSQVLAGHESDVFSCGFNYKGDIVVTASKDNTCKIWR